MKLKTYFLNKKKEVFHFQKAMQAVLKPCSLIFIFRFIFFYVFTLMQLTNYKVTQRQLNLVLRLAGRETLELGWKFLASLLYAIVSKLVS